MDRLRYLRLPGDLRARTLSLLAVSALALLARAPAVGAATAPVPGRVIVGFGASYATTSGVSTHSGADLAATARDQAVAPVAGTVVFAGMVPATDTTGARVGCVTVEAGRARWSVLPLAETWVRDGQTLREGEALGTIGASGDRSSAAAHVHVSLRESGAYRDPVPLFAAAAPDAGEQLPAGSPPSGDEAPAPRADRPAPEPEDASPAPAQGMPAGAGQGAPDRLAPARPSGAVARRASVASPRREGGRSVLLDDVARTVHDAAHRRGVGWSARGASGKVGIQIGSADLAWSSRGMRRCLAEEAHGLRVARARNSSAADAALSDRVRILVAGVVAALSPLRDRLAATTIACACALLALAVGCRALGNALGGSVGSFALARAGPSQRGR